MLNIYPVQNGIGIAFLRETSIQHHIIQIKHIFQVKYKNPKIIFPHQINISTILFNGNPLTRDPS